MKKAYLISILLVCCQLTAEGSFSINYFEMATKLDILSQTFNRENNQSSRLQFGQRTLNQIRNTQLSLDIRIASALFILRNTFLHNQYKREIPSLTKWFTHDVIPNIISPATNIPTNQPSQANQETISYLGLILFLTNPFLTDADYTELRNLFFRNDNPDILRVLCNTIFNQPGFEANAVIPMFEASDRLHKQIILKVMSDRRIHTTRGSFGHIWKNSLQSNDIYLMASTIFYLVEYFVMSDIWEKRVIFPVILHLGGFEILRRALSLKEKFPIPLQDGTEKTYQQFAAECVLYLQLEAQRLPASNFKNKLNAIFSHLHTTCTYLRFYRP